MIKQKIKQSGSVFNVFFDPMDNLLSGRKSRLFTLLKTGANGGDTPATCFEQNTNLMIDDELG